MSTGLFINRATNQGLNFGKRKYKLTDQQRAMLEFNRLDALSRQQKLSDADSLLLQLALDKKHGKRASHGIVRELAKHGVKRPAWAK